MFFHLFLYRGRCQRKHPQSPTNPSHSYQAASLRIGGLQNTFSSTIHAPKQGEEEGREVKKRKEGTRRKTCG
ncbi:unnamed protein product [Cuscuta epithymum]|uniref:Uncharacterized protein n=1 Tax=Cuscuta epithymum TaxID=186058 RepID=A0AAV0G080_9ASTE|nr:unnamed protein product [Cuscuta epithymum]CAH9140699.1 unnamed protein product [Cuscuta epithymum]